MKAKLNVQPETAGVVSTVRGQQWLALVVGLVVAGVAGVLALAALSSSPSAISEHPAQAIEQVPEQPGVLVAPVSQSDIDALVRRQTTLREQLGVLVAPVNQADIDALMREHTGREP